MQNLNSDLKLLKSKFCLILSVNRVNDWMLLKITEKIIWENALNKRKRNSGLNLTLGYALSRPSNNSSCKKSWVPLQNQWAPIKIKTSLKFQGVHVTRQLIWKTDCKRLQYTEIKGAVSRNSAKLVITKCPLNPRET